MFPALCLNRRLSQQFFAKRERVKKLAVQIVAVGEHEDGGILHRRVLDDFSGIENHGKTFAAALRVPDDTRPPVSLTPSPSPIRWERVASRSQRGFHGFVDSV